MATKLPKRVGLRPHHVINFVENKKDNYRRMKEVMRICKTDKSEIFYTEKTIDNTINFLRELSKSQNTNIEVVGRSADDCLCNLCNRLIDGRCSYSKGSESEELIEEIILELRYGLSIGKTIAVNELERHMKGEQ